METTIGKRIAAARKDAGLTQEALAGMLNVSPQAVSKWENDQAYPDISLLPELAKILSMSVDTLLSGESAAAPAVQILPAEQRKDISEMILRIVVDSGDGDKVRVNLPLALVQAAMDAGIEIAQFSGSSALKNIDLSQILAMAKQGVVGNLVEVDSADGDMIRIRVE